MADYNYQSLQGDYAMSNTAPSYQNEANYGDSEEDDYDPSNLQFGVSDVQEPHPAQEPEPPAIESPATIQQAPSFRPPSIDQKSPVAKAPSKQRIVGGFVDDDDEDDVPMAGANGQVNVAGGTPSMPMRSVTQTPSNTLPPPDTSIDKAAQDQGSSGVAVSSISTDSAPNGVAPVSSSSGVAPSQTLTLSNPSGANAPVQSSSTSTVPLPKARLPQDRVGILEDRIAEDPRGDVDAWLSLINEHQRRSKFDDARAVYERFFKIFPSAAEQWVAYLNMELQQSELKRVEDIFARTLMTISHVQLWSLYLNYVRRHQNLTTDTTGAARNTVQQAFDFTLKKVGVDKDSGHVWHDYINFVKSGPGNIGGSGWQDQQKMDALRTAYRRALAVPTQITGTIWPEYTSFEVGLNKVTGRKFLQEKMPAYMQAKQAYIALQNKTRDLNRTTLPRLPPAPGFDGYDEYEEQVKIWKDWIEWEKEDPLVLKDEDSAAYKDRILYVYKQALMALRFEPQIWYDAVEFCFANDLETEGDEFLKQGIEANPESCLLTFRLADRLEASTAGISDLKERGNTVREPYSKLLDALYDLIKKVQAREEKAIAQIQDTFTQEAQQEQQEKQDRSDDDEEDADDGEAKAKERAERQQVQVRAVQESTKAQVMTLRRTLTSAWMALIRAMRRVQGKGKVGDPIPGSRGVFQEARKRGQLTCDIYIWCALMEHTCYKDPSAIRLFDRGLSLFPEDENFALEYIKHLININDITNARAVFEKAVSKLAQKPETVPRAKPLYLFFHDFESKYGELAQISKLEQRMRDLFPEDPNLRMFTHRYQYHNALNQTFDPTIIRPIISPATQMRIGSAPIPSIEKSPAPSVVQSPRVPVVGLGNNSPKRPFMPDGSDLGPPRKLARGESPLKGAAGRRLDAARRRAGDTPQHTTAALPPPPLPRDINFLLSVLPKREFAQNMQPIINPQGLVQHLRTVDLGSVNWHAANLKAAGPGLLQVQRFQQQQQQQQQQQAPPPATAMPPTPTYAPPPMQIPPPQQAYYPPTSQYGYPPPINAPYPQYR